MVTLRSAQRRWLPCCSQIRLGLDSCETLNQAQARIEIVPDENLYEALRGYWHPVAYVSELADGGPLPVTLLDEPLVLARIDGAVSAFRDICVHRGTALSLGSVDESGLRCGYHGWTYNGEGRCTKTRRWGFQRLGANSGA